MQEAGCDMPDLGLVYAFGLATRETGLQPADGVYENDLCLRNPAEFKSRVGVQIAVCSG